MTVVSIAGVAIGVGALVLVLSVMGGFESDLRRKMLSGEPHLEVISATNALGGFRIGKIGVIHKRLCCTIVGDQNCFIVTLGHVKVRFN